jgi:hypothetical protein
MSKPNLIDILMASCPSHVEKSTDLVDELVRLYISDWTPDRALQGTGCMLTDIGDFLTRAVSSLSVIAERMVVGPHIQDNAAQILDEMNHKDEMTDLHLIETMDTKYELLKYLIPNRTRRAHRTLTSSKVNALGPGESCK